ncbi:MAG TPA: sortase [Longilinea sp.]|nr:sortase [Longilinea sp.]
MKSHSFGYSIVLRILFFFTLGIGVALSPVQTAQAATCTVTTNADSGSGSLRDLLGDSTCTTINFNSDASIVLDSTLTIGRSMTIDGAGHDITINGQGLYRVMLIGAGVTASLKNLIITNGVAPTTADDTSNNGGGIYNNGILTITNSTFSENTASNAGGGIFNNGTISLTSCTFNENAASNFGAGVFNGSSMTVTDSTFYKNVGGWGGAIWNQSSLTLTDTVFDSNETPNGDGAGINNRGDLTATDCTFENNVTGSYGGAIYNGNATATVTGSVFTGNRASGYMSPYGGAICNINSGSMTITNSVFSGNSADSGGGVIYNANSSTIKVIGSTLTGNSSWVGGGLFNNNSSTATMADSTLTGNSAASGGAVIIRPGTTVTLLNDTFYGNSASYYGADVFNYSGTLNYANSILSHPLAGTDCEDWGWIGTNTANLVQDGSCSPALDGDPTLGPLADNGGPTQTMALLAGSPAIDAGDTSYCAADPVNDKDQRGVTRPQGAHCDIGAFEYGAIIPLVTTTSPAAGAAAVNLRTLTVTFNQDMLYNGSSKAANDTANYMLMEPGPNGVFDTLSCKGGIQGDDKRVSINNATYNSSKKTATLTLNNFLPSGSYRLFVCGTTSIWSAAGLELNNGANDAQIDFTASSSTMPSTGFAPGRVTVLGFQTLSYATLGNLWLEIPRLGVQEPIAGVPQSTDGSWDVSWLGDDVGWLNGTAFPTWAGNSVLTGHVYDANGQPGPFWSIDTLRWGDQVVVHMGADQYIYEVREVIQVDPLDTAAMLKHEDSQWITLVTCRGYSGTGDNYEYRILVRAALVDVKTSGSR